MVRILKIPQEIDMNSKTRSKSRQTKIIPKNNSEAITKNQQHKWPAKVSDRLSCRRAEIKKPILTCRLTDIEAILVRTTYCTSLSTYHNDYLDQGRVSSWLKMRNVFEEVCLVWRPALLVKLQVDDCTWKKKLSSFILQHPFSGKFVESQIFV